MATSDAGTVVMEFSVARGMLKPVSSALASLADSLEDESGFVSRDEHLDVGSRGLTLEWRFRSVDEAAAWAGGAHVSDFLSAVQRFLEEPPVTTVLSDEAPAAHSATLVVTSRARPGQDAWFAEWQGRVGAAEQQFPGFIGQRVQAPVDSAHPNWVTVVSFETRDHLQAWVDSPQRKALIDEAAPYVQRFDVRPASSAFESWFARNESGIKPPPAWKLSAIVLLVLYPIVMLELFTLNHLTVDVWNLEPALAVFIGNFVSVAITGFVLIPWASRLLNWWLVPPEGTARERTRFGALVLVALYALSVVIFTLVIRAFPGVMP